MKIPKIIFLVMIFMLSTFSIMAQKQKNEDKGTMVTLTSDNYKSEIQKGLVVVDFWADWCGPCRKLEPILKTVMSETNIKLGKLNVDNYKKQASQMGITTIPTIIIYKDGEEVKRLVGLYTKDELIEIVKSYK